MLWLRIKSEFQNPKRNPEATHISNQLGTGQQRLGFVAVSPNSIPQTKKYVKILKQQLSTS